MTAGNRVDTFPLSSLFLSQIENVDFSQPVVADMCRAHSGVRPRMTWRVMDVTDMSEYVFGCFFLLNFASFLQFSQLRDHFDCLFSFFNLRHNLLVVLVRVSCVRFAVFT